MAEYNAALDSEIDLLDTAEVSEIIAEIKDPTEVDRRARSLKRHRIYRDGGKDFLIEQIRREFDEDAVKEMRLAPINLLKTIVNKRSSLYGKPVIRTAEINSDQKLIEYYEQSQKVNQAFRKANRYFNLDSNTIVYVVPNEYGQLCTRVIPAYLYSVKTECNEKTEAEAYILSDFTEQYMITQDKDPAPATGLSNFVASKPIALAGDEVDSNEYKQNENRRFIFWTDLQHATFNGDAQIMPMDPTKGEEQYLHELGLMPIVNIAKERDNQYWATQGEDMIDLTLAIQSGWSDLLTIAKIQGFALLTVVSEEAPTKMVVGLNKAVWLKQNRDSPTPSIDYKSSGADLNSYKELLMELLGLLLSTNNMNPKSVGGSGSAQSFTSGFQALIEMSDTLEAREEDKPIFNDAEKDYWEVIKTWHNRLYDAGTLYPEAKALGKFSDTFNPSIVFSDMKPLESEKERLDAVKEQRDMGLMTKAKAMKRLYPDMTDKQIASELADIQAEKDNAAAAFNMPPADNADAPADPNAKPDATAKEEDSTTPQQELVDNASGAS